MEQIITAIGREPEFGKQRQQRLAGGRFVHQGYSLIGIKGGIRHADRGNSDREAHEIVTIEIEEIVALTHCRSALEISIILLRHSTFVV
jgi:hypothetical protein